MAGAAPGELLSALEGVGVGSRLAQQDTGSAQHSGTGRAPGAGAGWTHGRGARGSWRDSVEGQRANTGWTQGQEKNSEALLARAEEAALLSGAVILRQVWVDSHGGLSASSNISISHLLSSLVGVIQAWNQGRDHPALLSDAQMCDCTLKDKNPKPVTLSHCKH